MPEPYWPKRKGTYPISEAEKNTRYARVWCTYCKHERYFRLADLRTAFGNIECDDIVYQGRWRCSNCDGKGSLDCKVEDPPASKSITVRRLVEVRYVRRPVWKDERQ